MRVVRVEGGQARAGGPELAGPGAFVWVDSAPTPENLAFLAERFRFHPLALEDCAQEDSRVKFEQYPEALFAVVHRVAPTPDDAEIAAHELDAFLTAEALVTVHGAPIAEVDRVFERCATDAAPLSRGPDFALYLVHDAITDAHFAVVDALTSDIEEVAEEAVGDAPEDDLVHRISAARRSHSTLRRRLSPQREVYAALARPGQAFVRDQTAVYFRDVVDHVVRLTEEIDTGRDLLGSSMESYLSRTNNRLTAVTTRMSLVATIFLPLNFLVGFFGMNLEILTPRVAIPFVLSVVVLGPAGLFWYFRRKRLL